MGFRAFFCLFFFGRTRPPASMRTPCLIYRSTSVRIDARIDANFCSSFFSEYIPVPATNHYTVATGTNCCIPGILVCLVTSNHMMPDVQCKQKPHVYVVRTAYWYDRITAYPWRLGYDVFSCWAERLFVDLSTINSILIFDQTLCLRKYVSKNLLAFR